MSLQRSQEKAGMVASAGGLTGQIYAARPEAADGDVQQDPTLRDFRLLLDTLGESFMLMLAMSGNACLAPGPLPQ